MALPKYTHSDKAMATLKASTRQLVDLSIRDNGRPDPFEDRIDHEIIATIELINSNPDIATTGSSSGRDGWPFIGVIFRDSKTRDRYKRGMRDKGINSHKTAAPRMPEFFEMNFLGTTIHEE